jgi:ABC-type Fe3+-hydroxamate transport system substrate-binding protein
VTKFCVHPKGIKREKTIIGGTKNFLFDRIADLNPDLIIGNKEENYREGISILEKRFPVWMSDIYHLEDALQMIERVGEITAKEMQANQIIEAISSGFKQEFKSKGSVLYLIWQDPLMAVGSATFIDDMLRKAGYINTVMKERYPVLSPEQILELNPEHILLSSEPYPFRQKHVNQFSEKYPEAKIRLVDGEMFSWYGSRLLKAAEYLNSL